MLHLNVLESFMHCNFFKIIFDYDVFGMFITTSYSIVLVERLHLFDTNLPANCYVANAVS